MNQALRDPTGTASQRIRVVIIGGGFAGLNAAKSLGNREPFDVTLIDRLNHYTFQPLLYQVATAALSVQDIAEPLRSLLSRYRNIRVLLGEADDIDVSAKCVHTSAGRLSYDYLLVACGAQTGYFGHERAWEPLAPGLKTLAQAAEIRARVLGEFEAAERDATHNMPRGNPTFVIIGGGPTGVELAGAIAEISRRTLTQDFRAIRTANARIVLIEAGPRLLASFDPRMSERSRRDLEAMGVEVRVNAPVCDIGERLVVLDDERIEGGVILWAAGIRGVPIAETLGVPLDKRGCVPVTSDCTIPGHPEVFVAGDLAVFLDHKTGKPLGQLATVATQQGRFFARTLKGDLRGKPRKPFRYVNKGQLATIGTGRAICEFGTIRFAGFIAWLVWIGIHIYSLSSMRDRLFVFMSWAWSITTWARHARVLIPSHWRTYDAEPANDALEAGTPVKLRHHGRVV